MTDSRFTFTASDGKRYQVTGIGTAGVREQFVSANHGMSSINNNAAVILDGPSAGPVILVEPVERRYEVTVMSTPYAPVGGDSLPELIGQYAAMYTAWVEMASTMSDLLLVVTDRMLAEDRHRIDTGTVTARLEPARTSSGYMARIERNGDAI